LDHFVLVAVATAFFCGGLVKGVVGMGLPLTSIALMTTVLDLRLAVPLLVVPILATNIMQAFRGGRFLALLRRYWPMVVTAAIGVWAGAAMLYRIELSYLLITLGVVVAAYSLINLSAIRLSVSENTIPFLSPVVGFLSGILAGTTGSIGVPVAIYYQALGMAKDVFVQAVGVQFLMTGSFMALALIYEGGLDAETLPISALAMVPAFVGMAAGQWVRNKVSEDRFRTWLWVFMIVIGLNLIRKGLF
jgi:uncharacterized membrane protein YfcA